MANRKFGFHSGVVNCRDIVVDNDFTVKGDLIFGDASTDTLTVNGALTLLADNLIGTNKKIQFRDTGLFIHSSADGKITYSSDGAGADDHIFSGTVTFNDDVTGLVSTVTDAGHTHTATVTDAGHSHTATVTDAGHTHTMSNVALPMGIITGALGVATNYMAGAVGAADATERFIVMPFDGSVYGAYGFLGTAPGGSDTVIVTVRRNGADGITTFTITGADVAGNNTVNHVSFSAGDRLSVKAVSSAGTAADLSVTLKISALSESSVTGATVANSTDVTGATVANSSDATGVTVATL